MKALTRNFLSMALAVTVIVGLVLAMVPPASADAAPVKRRTCESLSRPTLVPSKSKVKKKIAAGNKLRKLKSAQKKGKGVGISSRSKKKGGRCEPQSLTYARQRSGIMRSRNGSENGPLTWFASERKLGKTSSLPLPGSVLILGADRGHRMETGHVAYVEKVSANGPSSYRIVFSHTNYDRRCSCETNIEGRYNSETMTLDIFSGAWQAWGKGLKVAGFIEQ